MRTYQTQKQEGSKKYHAVIKSGYPLISCTFYQAKDAGANTLKIGKPWVIIRHIVETEVTASMPWQLLPQWRDSLSAMPTVGLNEPKGDYTVRFAYGTMDKLTRFTDYRDIKFCSRTVFPCHRSETLQVLLNVEDSYATNF